MVVRFKHIGIHVFDLDGMVRFYQDMFDLVVTDYSVEDKLQICFMSASPEDHHQIVLIGGRRPGSVSSDLLNQMSHKADTLDEVIAKYRKAKAMGLEEIEPVSHGNAWSCYFRDPEGNRQEVYCDTPWYVEQPHFTLMDFDRPADEIRAETEKMVRSNPTYCSREAWMSDVNTKISTALSAR